MKEFGGLDELEVLEDRLSGWFNAKSEEVLKLAEGEKLLDIGCGIGTFSRILSEGGYKVTGIDVSEKCLMRTKDIRGRFIIEDITRLKKLKKSGGSFDCVIALDVLEHIDDEVALISNVRYLLKDKGVLVLTVPAFKFLYSSHDRKIGHKRRYRPGPLKDLLKSNGFRVEKIFYWNLPGLFGWLGCKLMKKNPVGAANKRTDFLYKIWFSLESRIRIPIGLTLFVKARKI